MKRLVVCAVLFGLLVALLVASAQGSSGTRSRAGRVTTEHGSLSFTVTPSPPCDPEDLAEPSGKCAFEIHGTLKVKSARECRGRDVKIFHLEPAKALISTPNTNGRGVGTTNLDGPYYAYYPGELSQPDYNNVNGGTTMYFRAVAPRFRNFVYNNPFRTLVCAKLKSGIEEVVAPTPPPPPP